MASRVDYLDGVRGIAILLVLVAHVFPDTLTVAGPLGVLLFFVLSGYLITALLVVEFERRGRIDLGRFFLRRAPRLLPALVVTMALYLAYLVIRGGGENLRDGLVGVVIGLAYVMDLARAVHVTVPPALGPLWSLSVEEHFYLFWPLVVGTVLRLRGPAGLRRGLRVALAVSVPFGIVYAFLPFVSRIDFYFLPMAWFGSLAAGAFVAVMVPKWSARVRISEHGRATGLPGHLSSRVLLMAALVLAAFLGAEQIWIGPTTILLGVLVAGAVASATLAWLVLVPGSRLRQVLAARPLVRLGQISYGVYLLNYPVILLAEGAIAPTFAVRALACGASVALALLLFRWVERPALRLKSRWAARPELVFAAVPDAPVVALRTRKVS